MLDDLFRRLKANLEVLNDACSNSIAQHAALATALENVVKAINDRITVAEERYDQPLANAAAPQRHDQDPEPVSQEGIDAPDDDVSDDPDDDVPGNIDYFDNLDDLVKSERDIWST